MIKYIQTINKDWWFKPAQIEDDIPFVGYKRRYAPKEEQAVEEDKVSNEIEVPKEEAQVLSYTPSAKISTIRNIPFIDASKEKDEKAISGKGKRYTDRKEFVADLTAAYEKELSSRGIDKKYAKFLVAQDALESSWGKSSLSENFNFGGVKATKGTPYVEKSTVEYDKNKNKYTTVARFRSFNSLDDYVKYKISLLGNSRYNAFTNSNDDAKVFYTRVKAGGYATDPNYVRSLLNIVNSPVFARLGTKLPNIIKY